ncbi:hypothetical protein OC844_007209 [Tilletia horrida]|nr:hypothetical protein OC844_007209 [Tilletia horrida]
MRARQTEVEEALRAIRDHPVGSAVHPQVSQHAPYDDSANTPAQSSEKQRMHVVEYATQLPAPADIHRAATIARFVEDRILTAQRSCGFFVSPERKFQCSETFPNGAKYAPGLHTTSHGCGLSLFAVLLDNLFAANTQLHEEIFHSAQRQELLAADDLLGCAVSHMGDDQSGGVYVETPDWAAAYVGTSRNFKERETSFLAAAASASLRAALNSKLRAVLERVPADNWARVVLLRVESTAPILARHLAETALNIVVGATDWRHLNIRFVDGLATEAPAQEQRHQGGGHQGGQETRAEKALRKRTWLAKMPSTKRAEFNAKRREAEKVAKLKETPAEKAKRLAKQRAASQKKRDRATPAQKNREREKARKRKAKNKTKHDAEK